MSRSDIVAGLERAVDAEVLRRTVRAAVWQNGQHLTALLIGVPRTVVRKFLAMSDPRPATMERIREWARRFPAPEVASGTAALVVLASVFPAPHRMWARRQLAHTLAAMHLATGAPAPEWLREECEMGSPDPVGDASKRLDRESGEAERDT